VQLLLSLLNSHYPNIQFFFAFLVFSPCPTGKSEKSVWLRARVNPPYTVCKPVFEKCSETERDAYTGRHVSGPVTTASS